ncbi:DedA family protein [Frankia sp. AgB1.9]|uniref:DedA family protein n=1 Tax=unclassified Frankia TaxID=2632575 RepID=UPI00193371D6|nr:MULTISPECIES: DedA family protein [unclassified Frankia]MBL7489172.1 DedA family protein [Frankia sp. AgW1.1]MBL7554088.1 DedA family protein [Frankia sp. AgB1.9]MBL7618507.1 DedA family protein [Frankia sp. AgB1.8]
MDVDHLSGLTLYLTVFAIVFLESGVPIGFWLPGDAMLFATGLMAANPAHRISLPVLAAGVTVMAVAGVCLGYVTGRRLGRPWLERRHQKILDRTETFYDRFGPVTLIAARFVPWARTFAPILAGAVRMPPARFLAAAAVGAVIWGTGIPALGYAASSVPGLKDATGWLAPAVVALSLAAGVPGELLRRRARRRNRAAADLAVAGATEPDGSPDPAARPIESGPDGSTAFAGAERGPA